MKKVNIIAAIVSAIALIGDLVFMFGLFSLSEASSALNEAATTPDMQTIASTFSTILTAAWIWSAFVLVACLFTIYLALFQGRKKK